MFVCALTFQLVGKLHCLDCSLENPSLDILNEPLSRNSSLCRLLFFNATDTKE